MDRLAVSVWIGYTTEYLFLYDCIKRVEVETVGLNEIALPSDSLLLCWYTKNSYIISFNNIKIYFIYH